MTVTTRRYRFCASHRLHSAALSKAENQRTYGKCNNPHGHGHDYVLDVSVAGEVSTVTGLILNIAEFDRFVSVEALSPLSYRNLNLDVPDFKRTVPTTENLALFIASRLTTRWGSYFPNSGAYLTGISIQETDRNNFEVFLPRSHGHQGVAHDHSIESVSLNA